MDPRHTNLLPPRPVLDYGPPQPRKPFEWLRVIWRLVVTLVGIAAVLGCVLLLIVGLMSLVVGFTEAAPGAFLFALLNLTLAVLGFIVIGAVFGSPFGRVTRR